MRPTVAALAERLPVGRAQPITYMQLQPRHDGKKHHNPLPTAVSPPSGYGVLLKRWLRGTEEREPKAPLGPFWADAAALAAPVPAMWRCCCCCCCPRRGSG